MSHPDSESWDAAEAAPEEEAPHPAPSGHGLGPEDPDEDHSPSAVSSPVSTNPSSSSSLWCWTPARRWNEKIQKFHHQILLGVVLLLWPAGLWSLRSFLSKTDSTFHHPVHGSPSAAAQQAIDRKYANASSALGGDPSLVVVLSLVGRDDDYDDGEPSLVHDAYAQKSSLGLPAYLWNRTGSQGTEVVSYYGFRAANLSLLAAPFMAPDERTTFLEVALLPDPNTTTTTTKASRARLMDALDDYYEHEAPPPPGVAVGFTGIHYFSRDLRASTRADLHRMDTLVLPLALLLVGLTLRGTLRRPSWGTKDGPWLLRAAVPPLCGMITTVAAWSIAMDRLVVPFLQVTQFTPSIMMSLTLGMGLDYSLFLMARFLEETRRGGRTDRAVLVSLEQAGKVVLVSGTTLLTTFLALVALPLPMLQSVGVGASVAIASAIVSNLLVIPCLLCTGLGKALAGSGGDDNEASYALLVAEPRDDGAGSPVVVEPRPGSVWILLAKQVLHPHKSVIAVLLVAQVFLWPIATRAVGLKASNLSFESMIPADAPSLKTYHQLAKAMSGGGGANAIAPYQLLIDGTRGNLSLDSAESFSLQHSLAERLNATTGAAARASVTGVSVVDNKPIPYSVYATAKACGRRPEGCTVDALRCLNALDAEATSPDRLATILTVRLEGASPFGRDGLAWLDATRAAIEEWKNQTADDGPLNGDLVDVYIDGTAAVAHDAVTAVYGAFPRVVGTTLLVIFVLLGLVFRSVVAPLRSILSIAFTLSVSYGLAVLVYQDGVLNGLGVASVTAAALDPELSWVVPVMSFSIMVGLALDYDVFLVTRVLEFRFGEAYSHLSSVAAGMDATGGIITAAGVIMAVSFGSLLGSPSPALDQWAFLLTTAVLLDTFIVRSIVVPALMAWTGNDWSWYPRRLPPPRMVLRGFEEPTTNGSTPQEESPTVDHEVVQSTSEAESA